MKPLPFLLALILVALPSRAAVDPFYQGLLRDGQHAFDRKDYAGAARDLRLACFGMLEEPKALVDCLARLALAQDRLDDAAGFTATFQRIVEAEERFKAYSEGDLAPELRTALEGRVAARVPAATLQSLPAFRALVARKPEARPATPAPTAAAAPGEPGSGPAAAPTEDQRKKLVRARLLLAEQLPDKGELQEAFQLAREVADAQGGLREAQHLAAEAAYRLRRWEDAARYFRRGGDPGDDQAERLFYMAVSLYESGDQAAAATALKRALPNLQRTGYVDGYAKKILGQQSEIR